MANKTLTAKVRFDTKSAETSLNRLAKKINDVQKAINKTSSNNSKLTTQINKATTAQNRLNTAANKTANTTKKIEVANKKAVTSANKLSGAYNSANRSASNLATTVKRLAATYLGVMGMKAMIGTSDTITSTQNKLNALNGGNKNLTQEQMDKMYVSSNKVRMDYTDMLANASKSMTLAGSAFQGNMDNAIRFQEIMAETYALGGASAPEMSTSMYQMIQALGSGTLQGDELRSVREGAPLAYKAIEEFAQGIYNTEESLKELASQGKITSDMVVAAIMNAGDKIDEQFNKTAMTFGQAWNRIKSAAVKAFEPVSYLLNEMLNKAAENGAFEKIEQAFFAISKALQIAFQVIYNAVVWIVDNWNWLKHVLIGGLILYMSYLIMTTSVAVAQAIIRIASWITEYGWIMIIIAAVLALLYVFYLWKTGAIDTCQAIVSALLIVGVAVALIGLLMGNWIVAIVGLAIAAIGLIINYLDYFLAVVYSIGAAIWNIVVGVVNAIIQFLWTYFVEPWIGIIEWVLNVFNGGFNSFGDGVKNLLGNIISWFLSLGQVVTKIIDAIFGTNWTGGLEALKGKVLNWGKNENAITLSREAPNVLNRISYTDAWNTGMTHGAAGKEWLSGLGSQFQNGFEGFSLDNMGEKLGLNFGGGFPSGSDFDTSGAYSTPNNLIGDIANDTGSIADNMELSKDDLDYLRKIAEMEWKKEFTTAEIKVDMSNYNSINGDGDLDGIVTKLTDKLYEELNSVANGVYV